MSLLPSLPKLSKERLKLGALLRHFAGEMIVGLTADRLQDIIVRYIVQDNDYVVGISEIGDASVVEEMRCDEDFHGQRREAIRKLLEEYIGFILTPERMRKLVVSVVGRYDLLREGISGHEWNGATPVRTLLFVHEVVRRPTKGRQFDVEMEAMTGHSSGNRWLTSMSGGRIQMLLREAGVRKYDRYRDEAFSGMYLTAMLRYKATQLLFHDVEVSSSIKKYNLDLQKGRQFKCVGPCDLMKGHKCMPCPVPRLECPLSWSARGYKHKLTCKNGHVGFMQLKTDQYCLECLLKGKYDR